MRSCYDWVKVNDGTSTLHYCGFTPCDCGWCDFCGSIPGPVTGTTITVMLHTDGHSTASGFFVVVTGDATVTTDVTGESKVGKCIQ